MKVLLISIGFLWGMSLQVNAQVTYSFNVLADFEVSKAGEESHYFFNEINRAYTKPRAGISHLNLINHVKLDSSWSFHTRLWMQRDKGIGQIFYSDNTKEDELFSIPNKDGFSIPELNIQWLSSTRKFGITVGSFINPFGSFNKKQLSTQRNIIGLPLAYAYHTNISPKIGFAPGMGDPVTIKVEDEPQWGTTQLYYGGYTTGAMMSWNVKPGKVSWKLALVNGAPNANQEKIIPKFHNWGLISRLKIQPTYNWEQGFSVSHGTFMQESKVSGLLDNLRSYSQTMVGTDVKLGSGFFEFSGEVIGAIYRVPEFKYTDTSFVNGGDPLTLSSLSAYGDLKYELPFLQGSYVAGRLDYLKFSDYLSGNWDNQVWRFSFACGYHINQFLLARIAVSIQKVPNRTDWKGNQNTLRFVLTAHY
jgi:hypothetical protein